MTLYPPTPDPYPNPPPHHRPNSWPPPHNQPIPHPNNPQPLPPTRRPNTPPGAPGGKSSKSTDRWAYAAFAVALVFGVFIWFGVGALYADTTREFSNGTTLTPSADDYLILLTERRLADHPPSSVRCTATTESGRQLELSPPATPVTVSRGSRRASTAFIAVAELPVDQGPLRVHCSAAWLSSTGFGAYDLRVGKPKSDSTATVFLGGYLAFMAVLVGFVLIARRRYFKQNPHMKGKY